MKNADSNSNSNYMQANSNLIPINWLTMTATDFDIDFPKSRGTIVRIAGCGQIK